MKRRVKRAARGAAFFFLVLLAGGALSGSMGWTLLDDIKVARKVQHGDNLQVTQNARDALLSYMLRRDTESFGITWGRNVIEPQILMLPCPDNAGYFKGKKGDFNLDGTQDPTCGAKPPKLDNRTNYILRSGSRFGRLPYKRVLGEIRNAVRDGLSGEFMDVHGNRLWYAVSRNVAPTFRQGPPLNLHRLASLQEDWLTVGVLNGNTLTQQQRAAAVVLSPGRSRGRRISEEQLITMSLDYKNVNVSAYFESAHGHSNADYDGVFVYGSDDFDDPLSYISLESLLRADSKFMRDYTRLMIGGDGVHNAPSADTPLAEVRRQLQEWEKFFGFYPLPAANTVENIHSRARHCEVHRTQEFPASGIGLESMAALLPREAVVQAQVTTIITAAETITVAAIRSLPASVTIIPAATITATIISPLANSITILAARPWAINLDSPLSVSVGGVQSSVVMLTAATYSRLVLLAGATLSLDSMLLSLLPPNISIAGPLTLQAGVTLQVAANSRVKLPQYTPLYPGGMQQGWLPSHSAENMTVANDGTLFTLSAPLRSGFLDGATLTSATDTLTLASDDELLLLPPGPLQIKQNIAQVRLLANAILRRGGGRADKSLAAGDFLPTAETAARRRYAALLLADMESRGKTVHAPKIIYPWRQKTKSKAITRDNMHAYPPCPDTRFLPRRARMAFHNQSLFYAAAPHCYAGGDANLCGSGGITLTIAKDAQVAAAKSFALTGSYTVRVEGSSLTLGINRGAAQRNVTLTRGGMMIDVGQDAERPMLRLSDGHIFTAAQTITLPAGSTLYSGAQIKNIEAILIYSPAPLHNVRCADGLREQGAGSGIASQGGADLTRWCEWLDDAENADGDLHYVAHPIAPTGYPASNDFILFFGGRPAL